MRVLSFFASLCAFVSPFVWGATIHHEVKSPIRQKNAPSTKTPAKLSVPNAESADPVAFAGADVDADADASISSDVDFVIGEDVANFSGKSQNQIFNQIVPLANVKDFYGGSTVHSFLFGNALWARIIKKPDCSAGAENDWMAIFSVFFFYSGPLRNDQT